MPSGPPVACPTSRSRVLAAWILHLRGLGAPVRDVRADELRSMAGRPLADAVPAVLAALGPELADDAELVSAVRDSATGG